MTAILKLRGLMARLLAWLEAKTESNNLSEVISAQRKETELEIAQANKVIVNHQFIVHMAEYKLKGFDMWQQRQERARLAEEGGHTC